MNIYNAADFAVSYALGYPDHSETVARIQRRNSLHRLHQHVIDAAGQEQLVYNNLVLPPMSLEGPLEKLC